jgi:hypothetical protein
MSVITTDEFRKLAKQQLSSHTTKYGVYVYGDGPPRRVLPLREMDQDIASKIAMVQRWYPGQTVRVGYGA